MITDRVLALSIELGKKLLQKNWQITCAESCTGGGIGYAITSAAGSSNWFERGFLTYSNQAKSELVDVKQATLTEFGAVSQEVVQQMAAGALKKANADVSIAVSGVAGPGGGSVEKPVGLVWFGLVVGDKTFEEKHVFSGDRGMVRHKTIEHAIERVIECL